MKKVILCLPLFLISFTTLKAQCTVFGTNLVPNPSFENTTGFCNGTDNQIYVDQSPLQSWTGTDLLSNAGSTPDIMRNDATTCGVGANSANNNCFTGTKCAGMFVFSTLFVSREYIQTPLTTPLTAGTTYCFSMTVRSRYGAAGNLQMNTDGMGVHFRNGGAINIQTMNGGNYFLGPGSTVNLTPHIQQPAGVLIGNTCTAISGTYTAVGGENRIVIGNFRTDAATQRTGSSSSSYIYVDDVQLYEVNPLPVELLEFKASCTESTALITWKTQSEHNSDYFIVERSCDGTNFTKIATINAAGNSTEIKKYGFIDQQPCEGTSYYRLTEVDIDGRLEVFDLIASNCVSKDEILLFPNPANDHVTLLNGGSPITELKLFAVNGDLVRDFSNQVDPHSTQTQCDVSDLQAGVYFLHVTQASSNPVTYKLVVE